MVKTEFSFSNKILIHSFITNSVASVLTFLLCSFFIMFRKSQLVTAATISLAAFLFGQIVVIFFMNRAMCSEIEGILSRLKNGEELSEENRTSLFKKLMKFPIKKGIEIFLYSMSITGILCFLFYWHPEISIDRKTAFMSLYVCVFSSYTIALVTLSFSQRIVRKYAEDIVSLGIDVEGILSKNFFGIEKNYFGISFFARTVLYVFLPIVFANFFSYIILKQGYTVTNGFVLGPKDQILRMVVANLFQLVLVGTLIMLYFNYLKSSSRVLKECTMELLETGNTTKELRTTISDQMQYNVYLLDRVIKHYRKLMDDFSDIGKNVLKSTDDLSTISGKISTVSAEQNNDVKEILTTMEDSNTLSKNVETRINEVSEGTDYTKYEISEAFYLLKENIQQLTEINSSNNDVISGIKNLAEQIDSIDDIVAIIKDIADQTKIIAFNAELEAVSSGEDGKNFHIVSTEIRRLANNTMESIEKIKIDIKSIQNASKSLINSSEKSTELIKDETLMTKKLEEQFINIMESSNRTNEKATEITSIIEQQTTSFNQIVLTLRQISAGIESFALSTKTITNTVNEMKEVSYKLFNMKEQL